MSKLQAPPPLRLRDRRRYMLANFSGSEVLLPFKKGVASC